VPVVMDGETVGYGYTTPPEQRALDPPPTQARTSPQPERAPAPSAPLAAATFGAEDVKAWSRMLFPDAPGNRLAPGEQPLIVECND
jgi:hypothetical protein